MNSKIPSSMVRRELKDEDVVLALDILIETVGEGGRGGLVDETEHVETSSHSGVLGGGMLGVIEVGGTLTTALMVVLR